VPSYRANVKPELLRWAGETIGLSPERAADRLSVQVDRLLAWESGESAPTVNQLRNAANVYKRPLAVFFFQSPPANPAPIHDFRRMPGEESDSLSPSVLLEVRRARRRRELALDFASQLAEPVLSFELSTKLNEDADTAAAKARDRIGVSHGEQSRWQGEYEPLNAWTSALESIGVLVFQTSRVEVADMRGFSLSERHFPVIVLNGADSPRARVFTLMHEFVHLMLHESGVCDPERASGRQSLNARVETFCNRVAGAILVLRKRGIPSGRRNLAPAPVVRR
jgi:transcriptional regulator with XRE-family HTH domain